MLIDWRWPLLITVLCAHVTTHASAQQGPASAWPQASINPQPAADDVLLPMPCGGAMAFRRIDTPTGTNPLDDRPVTLGAPDDETAYSEYVRSEAVAGSLRAGDGTRYLLIGKYEVTAEQFDAVTMSACPARTNAGRLPKVRVSWFEAVEFTQRWSVWLLQNAKDRLPARGGVPAYVRLPTDEEWEYAARGGASVQDAAFRERLFPMEKPLEAYVWHDGAQSANGVLRPIGRLAPNPVGLHDVLGNAAEMVMEPFRLNKVGRLHGQIGGFVVRGGDHQTPADRIRTSMRIELPPFDTRNATPTRLPTVGFRVAIGLTTTVDLQEATALGPAFAELSRSRLPASENPSDLLDGVIRQTEDVTIRAALQSVAATLSNEIRIRNEREAAAVRSSIQMGTLLIRSLRDYDNRLRVVTDILRDLERTVGPRPEQRRQIDDMRQNLAGLQAARDYTVNLYVDTLLQLADSPADVVVAQLPVVKAEYGKQGQSPRLLEWSDMFVGHTDGYRRTRKLDRDAWVAAIVR